MQVQIKTSSLFYTLTLFMCLNSFFLGNTDAQVKDETDSNYTFETIDVPGVEFLELTASSDFEDYAGNMRSADSEKDVGFTLIDGVFTTYDFPGSQGTTKIATVCIMALSWKTAKCGNTIFRVPFKRRYTVSAMQPGR